MVFGWSAAQSKHVRAYTKLYSADLGKYCFARNDRVKSIIVGYFNLNQHLARFEILVPLGYPVNWTFFHSGIGAHGYTMPMEAFFGYDQPRQSEMARQCLEKVAEENSGKNIIIHCFSNNGFTMYKHTSKQLKAQPHK